MKTQRVKDSVHTKMKLVALATGLSLQDAYAEAVEAYISKLKAENPLYNTLLHATDAIVEDNGSSATQDMFVDEMQGFEEQPKL